MKVRVPDIEHKTLCYKQKLKPPGAMSRCTYLKNHKGKHSWEENQNGNSVASTKS